MEWLSPELLQVGAGGLVTLAVIAIFTGWLVPRWQVKQQLQQANTEAQNWRTAYDTQTARADLAQQQSTQLLARMETVEALIRSIAPPNGRP